jgi:hypothetical protein
MITGNAYVGGGYSHYTSETDPPTYLSDTRIAVLGQLPKRNFRMGRHSGGIRSSIP